MLEVSPVKQPNKKNTHKPFRYDCHGDDKAEPPPYVSFFLFSSKKQNKTKKESKMDKESPKLKKEKKKKEEEKK